MAAVDTSRQLQEQVQQHIAAKQPLRIQAGGSKAFYGRHSEGAPLDVSTHRGVIHYEPTELVISARCGTPLAELQDTLATNQQMLAFEPPAFADTATLGGCVATGLSGPRRPFSGAVRDFVLGVSIINGQGEQAKFGGEVMKNVAGYDVSRLMVGSCGTLGVLLDVSLKVLPKPETEITLSYELAEHAAIARMSKYCAQALPVSATCFNGHRLYIRLSGSAAGVKAARILLGGEVQENTEAFWQKIREQTHPFFNSQKPLWRLSLAPAAPPIDIEGKQLIEWRGAQRWLLSDAPAETIHEKLHSMGGHATLFRRGQSKDDIFQPLHGKLRELHMNIKLAMDPHCIFNVGAMYSDF